MSCNYYKKVPTKPPPTSFGFKQVNARELQDILKRVTTPTYSNKLHSEEQRQVNNYDRLLSEGGRRSVASACGRRVASACGPRVASRISSATSGGDSIEGRGRRFTEKEMARLVRRLQRPTTATSYHNRSYYDEDAQQLKEGRIVRARSADIHSTAAKSLVKLRRPTTATLAKTLNTCHLCYEHENKTKPEELDAFDYEYSADKVVPEEEVNFIVGRVSVPTHASSKGEKCQRLPEYIDEVKIRENLPLLSGLRRSKNVQEITERLFPRRKCHGFTAQETTITTY
ncbi:hypothetical protein MAR_036084 [Mya arenaria]|uniref:Uncharacterized protein n=1 Tax=Mya arenaria TaxID=6604 RepID=A0ABY7ELZ3_MYAAR|nr:uncharacterized protein LOC128241531 [Mya arenaria]XP_052814462.1 uncharacterized protein LOC128241531 [Mya arenaria]XP_052814541.1 uncharacterized protein LOC128241578 [Mya arenaria]XP_052814542.1 uncharacterized protein LOC128241578 [Mya arenaria]XP_052814543.1 uncharacterized protein LOC128241578 [Mya arenaria]WAR10673.1 hypothetical protein MAR_035749 [Mya arenaria]WAR11008.1 hypothetical protein MAR_036084 [Mya arenaria]